MHAAQARTLGPYELLEPIGEGGFARVHHARKDGRSFAIKILSPSVRDAQTESRFAREVAALGALKHPNLIELCDHGVDEVHGPYLVMPLVAGMSLRDLARGGAGGLAPEAALLLIEPVLRALSVLHAASLVHRDVKPENVLVTPLGEVIVVDLGLALHEAHSRLTEAGTITGSVPYMSPEQIEGRSITAASDLWSIGVVLYELITGRRPFARERPSEELASILASSFEPLDAADRRVGPELAAFVARCLSRNAQDRFRDAASALEELSACFDWITPREVRAERTKVVTDPRGYAGHVAPKRAALLVSEAKEILRGGDPFGALRVLDRALAYAPSDPEVLALVDRASEGRSLPPEPPPEPAREPPGARSIGEVDTLPAKSLARTLRLLVSEPSKRKAPPKKDAPGARPARSAARRASPLQRLRAWHLLAGGLALAGVIAGWWAWWLWPSSEREIAIVDDASEAGIDEAPARARLEPSEPSEREPAQSPMPPLLAADLADLTPIPPGVLSNDDPPRPSRDVARPGEPLVPASLLGVDGPAGALRSLEAQLAARPGEHELEVSRALALLGNSRTEEGLRELERLRRAYPDLPIAWSASGYVAYRQGRTEEAERFLSRAIELDPTSASDWRNRGILRSHAGRTRDAYADLSAALRYDPDDVQAMAELSQIYDRAGRRLQARPLLERVVRLSPRNVEVWVDLSMTHPEPERALAAVERAIEIDPDYARAHGQRCRLLAQHRPRDAIAACTRAAELAPRDGSVLMHRGLARYHQGDDAGALADLDRAVELEPDYAQGFVNRSIVHTHAGHAAQARRDLETACRLGSAAACSEVRR